MGMEHDRESNNVSEVRVEMYMNMYVSFISLHA